MLVAQPNPPITYERSRQKDEMGYYCKKLYSSKDVAASLLDYNYNVLVSMENNGILFTNGDNDTYPLWILQYVHQIRSDILVLNQSFL